MSALEHVRKRAPILVLALAVSLLQAASRPRSRDPSEPLAIAEISGDATLVGIDPGSFVWAWPDRAAEGGPMAWHPAAFLARRAPGAPRDLFTAEFRVTADGLLREARRVTDISRTADADEDVVTNAGEGRVAFSALLDGAHNNVTVLDFSGEPADLTDGWSRWWKLANAVTNFQQTGRAEGLGWRTYLLLEPAAELVLEPRRSVGGAALEVRTERCSFSIDRDGGTDSREVVVQEMVKGHPALIAWAVDTARAIPWVGRRRIEWLEKVWFDLSDWLARVSYEIAGSEEPDPPPGEPEAEGALTAAETGVPGWPPKRMEGGLERRAQGEGIWTAVDDGVFAPDVPGPPLFYYSFLRMDRERPFARVHMTAWDPARVGLHMMAGVREPVSTTGMRGAGEVPRERGGLDHVSRLVGAFNGAFQALHGEWGMVLDRRVFLPPRAYGATIAVFDDGRAGFGTWPHPVGELPPEVKDLRQNVNPVVEGGVPNPYRRKWWGGVPQGVEERVFTVRSGVCLTRERKMVYFWGEHMSPETLGGAMLAAGCDYGLHLDMNTGHCGFEHYRVDPAAERPRLDRRLRPAMEAEGVVPGRDDLLFRARKMVREMGHMRFPRYVGRDPRDFFYLVLRPSIFDDPPDGLEWRALGAVVGLPVPAVAAELGGGVEVVKLDSGQVALAVETARPDDAVFAVPFSTSSRGVVTGLIVEGAVVTPPQPGAPGVEIGGGGAAILEPGEEPSADTLVQGVTGAVGRRVDVGYAVAADGAGNLLVASGGGGFGALEGALETLGTGTVVALLEPDASGGGQSLWLVARHVGVPAAERIFEHVRPVPPSVWRGVYRERGHLLDHEESGS